tara:strand:- start:389 stop:697 length:309 start_codon:yes stop_codon:yes gene_type:complete
LHISDKNSALSTTNILNFRIKKRILKFVSLIKEMTEKKASNFERIGYIKNLPNNADINDYESISVKNKDGKLTTLYRQIVEERKFDDTTNFSNSRDVFNSLL